MLKICKPTFIFLKFYYQLNLTRPKLSFNYLVTRWTLLVGNTPSWFPDTSHHSSWIRHKAIKAGTLSSLIHNLALSIWPTRSFPTAGILTPVCNTGKGSWTISVYFAAHEAHVVEAHVAKEAVVVETTRQHAHALLTSFIVGTVVVALTPEHADTVVADHALGAPGIVGAGVWNPDAFNFRISGKCSRAGADFEVVSGLAEGIEATSVSILAGISAAATEADLIRRTLTVRCTIS